MAIFRNGKEPAERDTRTKVFDARPPERRTAKAALADAMAEPAGIEEMVNAQFAQYDAIPSAEPQRDIDLESMRDDIRTIVAVITARVQETKIEQIKTIGRSLTYGEMVELADAVWAAIPHERELTREMLPAVLHMFATT
jgi:hypothetical protein